jgi:hypothetical protein
MRVGIQMKRGHGPWAKKEVKDKLIDTQRVFNDYLASNAHNLTVPGQS